MTAAPGSRRSSAPRRLGLPLVLAALTVTLSGCGTFTSFTSYQALTPAGPATPDDYPLPVYPPELTPPRPCRVLGLLAVNPVWFTLEGPTVSQEMAKIMRAAHAKGADAVQITTVQKPGFDTPDFSIHARLLRYTDTWERIPWTESQVRAYLHQNLTRLDPIEGIWTDGLPRRLAIIRDATQPGRDFVAFTLTPDPANWQAGDKKMDVARGNAPGAYAITYYQNDFSAAALVVSLENNRRFQFILNVGDQSFPVAFTKLEPPAAPPAPAP